MKLVRMNPAFGFDNAVRRMNHFMNEMDRGGVVFDRNTFNATSTISPRVDIAEDATHFTITMELAGVPKEAVNVAVDENRVLTVSGERKQEEKKEGKNFHRVERRYGSFSRSFTLPDNVADDSIEARFENGVLSLSIPKKEDQKPQVKSIEVK